MTSAAARAHPAIVGVAELANRDGERIVHPVDLVADAARRALAEAGIAVDAVGGVLATPFTTLDQADASEVVAAVLGCGPGLRGTSAYSGASPQVLLARAIRAVEAGAGAVLVVGGIADASVARARRTGVAPPAPPTAAWSQGSRNTTPDPRLARGPHLAEIAAGATLPPAWFALVESALPDADASPAHRLRLGGLLAPFTQVAATRPDTAWFPVARTAVEIATPTADNRLVAEPYTKLMCSFPTVDLAAAIVVAPARPGDERAVRPLALTAASEPGPPSTWAAMGRFGALHDAVATTLDAAAVTPDDLASFDLYSCFPSAVRMAVAAFGLEPSDPRPLTVTGGLAAFGGPGASYSLHALVATVERLRDDVGSRAAVVGVGGMVTDVSVGVYGVVDQPARITDLGVASPGVAVRTSGSGPAVVDAATVLHDRDVGPTAAPVVARLPDGSRVGARAADPDLPGELTGTSIVGTEVVLATDETGHVTYTTT